ncbi:MAG: VOC family protein [Pseudoalteromonas sp.]|uniref:VOC family protein n=1 Tax=unclassified Pseudoalteromonas TaxID=194690 RepID=UPI000C070307|nr:MULTISPECIES: VOC family protein [unclassified Pseudoalteromonas]MDP2633325.1 VOC family protein [Pseudoalteromonas sp. 1_MG-2023]PHN91704.1 glyoxalase [Pseudoalteromonas sp. 3D05]TGE84784.1 VOC family protein [Pseudoalteromonas sp. KS88]
MIGYTMVGTNDLEKAVAFYDQLLAQLGAQRFLENDRFVAWSNGSEQPGFSVTVPHNNEAATPGNGTMIAIAASSPAQVDAFYAKAIELGASDEGAPGPREMPGFYAGYFRDLDGNKLNVFCFTQTT